MSKKAVFAALVLFGLTLVLPAASSADARRAALRRAALTRPRRLIVNNDGCDVTSFPKGIPVTRPPRFGKRGNGAPQ